jgi:hypothetical protein
MGGRRFRLSLSRFRALMREVSELVPGDADPRDQAHVFDFDDTLGLTRNANGIMLYRDGEPAHKTEAELKDWLKSVGVGNDRLLNGPSGRPFEQPSGSDGWAAYLDSAGLARVQTAVGKNMTVTPNEPAGMEGDWLYVDFTPSSWVDPSTTDPIEPTIRKLKQANAQGSDTMVITARASDKSSPGVSFSGERVVPSNAEDMEDFLATHGAKPTKGVLGVRGQNKGHSIKSIFFGGGADQPEELHFYDDLRKNTEEVKGAIAGEVPAEVFIYGPGEFAHGEADPDDPDEAFPPIREGRDLASRWNVLSGIKRS